MAAFAAAGSVLSTRSHASSTVTGTALLSHQQEQSQIRSHPRAERCCWSAGEALKWALSCPAPDTGRAAQAAVPWRFQWHWPSCRSSAR